MSKPLLFILALTLGIAIGMAIALYMQIQISNAEMIYPANMPWIVWA